jgi:hypothetical protein
MVMLRTTVVALALLAAIGAASMLVQAEGLGRPTTAQLELVHTVQALRKYHHSSAVVQAGALRYVTSCRHHYVAVDGSLLPEANGRLVHHRGFDATAFELAGCPRPLVRHLTAELLGGARFEIRKGKVDGVRAWGMSIPGTRPALELYVSRRTGLPVELILQGRRMHARSDVTYSRKS